MFQHFKIRVCFGLFLCYSLLPVVLQKQEIEDLLSVCFSFSWFEFDLLLIKCMKMAP